ncbi:tRNA (adenosine(37)-N6)-dimethylallyltransferase MiaA [Microbacteriaceae bacterium]|nr:tRNA (adenosine(37)-N6)-dimethylallyltransferase MiaA [Candidatus Saccharibacteria bacterium]
MATMKGEMPPLIVIVGPTASGKSSLAMKLAEEFDGEIISADSRAIYKGLNIGTAKPTLDDQRKIVHWGIDLVDAGHHYSVKDFQDYANKAIEDIRSRGKVPLLVGGTGLYIDAVIYGYTFSTTLHGSSRTTFEGMSLDSLQQYCAKNNIKLPENGKNKRYVINTILRGGQKGTRKQDLIENTYVVGITTDRAVLRERIAKRANVIVTPAVLKEAMRVAEQYGWENEAMTANIYRLMTSNLTINDLEGLKEKFITLDWQLAKRQLTWLRRNEHTKWLSLDDAYTYCARILAKLNNT